MALIDKASLLMVPSTYEAGKLYNVLPSGNRAPDSTDQNSGYDQTRADFDFDRGSNTAATRIGSDGLIKKYRENLALYSQDFNNAAWAKSSILVNSNTEANPIDGSVDADTITASAGTTQKYIGVSNSVNGLFTYSFYAKYISQQFVQMFVGADAGFVANFDLQNGNQSASGCTATIVSAGNGWYRCSVFFTSTIGSGVYISPVDSLSSPRFSTTSSTNSFYLFGAQLETGLVATDYLESTSVTGKAGVLVDLPRINYDANGENGSLLLEPSRANLLPHSEYFNGGFSGSFETNAAISPDGTMNASKFVFTQGASYPQFYTFLSGLVVGQQYTSSIYIKKTEASEDFQMISSGVSFIPTDEWQRVVRSFTATSTSQSVLVNYVPSVGVGVINEVYVAFAQVEAGSYATSYIPNHGESGGVTRAADSCSVTGVSDVIGQTEGTIFVDLAGFDGNTHLVTLGDGTALNYLMLYISSGAIAWLSNGGLNGSAGSVTATSKAALAYKGNDSALYLDGVQVLTNTSSTIPSLPNVYLNNNATLTNVLKLETKQVTLFKERLSNAELAALTA